MITIHRFNENSPWDSDKTKIKFIAKVHQSGGCDYTIECGTQLVTLKATNLDDAVSELRILLEEDYNGDRTPESIHLYEISNNWDVSNIIQ